MAKILQTYESGQILLADDMNEIKDSVNSLYDAGFITNATNNLINYYLKTEVNDLIDAIQTAHFELVEELPQTGENNIIYLIPRSTTETSNNIYDEYIYISNAWEKIGSTDIDLTGYATELWVISNFLTETQIQNLIDTALNPIKNKIDYNELPNNIFKIRDSYYTEQTTYGITIKKINDYTFTLDGTATTGFNFSLSYDNTGGASSSTFSLKPNVNYYLKLTCTNTEVSSEDLWIRTSYFNTSGVAVQTGDGSKQIKANYIEYETPNHSDYLTLIYPLEVDKARFYLHIADGTILNNATLTCTVSTELPIKELIKNKQDKLTAGTNITIDSNNIISASGGGGGTVDQTYDPTSQNAQSGTAVAEAVKPINDKITNSFNSTLHKDLTNWQVPCARFSSLMKGDIINNIPAVENCEPFLFFTDPHTMGAGSISKFEEYMGQLQKVYNSTPTAFALCGGDWLGNSDTPEEACYKLGLLAKTCKTMLEPCYLLVGNHDTNYQGKKDSSSGTYTTRLPLNSIKNLWYNGKNAYYSFDGNSTRFYCFDTQIENSQVTDFNNYFYTQAETFANALLTETSQYIAIATHIYFNIAEKVDEVITLNNDSYVLQRHPMMSNSLTIKNNDKTVTRKVNIDYSINEITGEITSINSGLAEGDKATYKYYNGVNILSLLLMQIIYSFNNRKSITFNNHIYDFSQITNGSKIEFILAGHTHTDFLSYHNYEVITLDNNEYTITNSNIVRNSVFITDVTGSTKRSSFDIDYDTGTITNLGGIENGDIVHYDYGVSSRTAAGSTDIPIVLTMNMSRNNAANASFDLVFVDYDNRKIDCIRVGTGEDRTINLGERENANE